MADRRVEVVFLAGRLLDRDEIRSQRALADGLTQRGFAPRLIAAGVGPDHGIDPLLIWPGLERRWRLPLPWWGRALEAATRGLVTPGAPVLLHVLGADLADVGLDLAERCRVPYVLTVDEFPRRDARLRLSQAWCRGLVATNAELGEALVREYGVPAHFLAVVPRGIVESDWPRPEPNPARVPVIGAVGPLLPGSGFATYLNAARKVVDMGFDVEFALAGHGEGETDLRRRAERLRIADRFTFVDEKVRDLSFWEVLDIYCQTSISPTVGRSLAIARAHGVPTVASDVAGLRSVGDEVEVGLRVPHGDAGLLAQAIVSLLANPTQARRLGEAGRQAVLRDHHPDREAESLAAIYDRGRPQPPNSVLGDRLHPPQTPAPPTPTAGDRAERPELRIHPDSLRPGDPGSGAGHP